ncbi:MAG: hypothetical protein KDC12_14455 [Flavobacteriales bacterium]|nr:hypothetical protein [Flavobacteriales bacterium]
MNLQSRNAVVLSIALLVLLASSSWTDAPSEHPAYHGAASGVFPSSYNDLFTGSGSCVQCHGYDNDQIASVDVMGNDVNVVDDWSSTMMANSARDPFWRAKVSHEVFVNPDLQEAIEDKCTSCHAPLGNHNAHFLGAASYSIAEMQADSLAMDGVSCLACHQQDPESMGNSFSGHLHYDTSRVAYGPYESPLVSPMALQSQYTPVQSELTGTSEMCADCHTLITEAVDLEGVPTGTDFVEQATYHEWVNSDYNASGTSCQSCHMPVAPKSEVVLAAGYDTPPRSPFYQHEFAGANALMLSIIRDNALVLGAPASTEAFDETIAATMNMLQQHSCEVTLTEASYDGDTVHVDVALNNLAGHKFPSGYPARRAVVELIVRDSQSDTLFHSGGFDAGYATIGEDLPFEPHYDVIVSEDQVQIYEMVMGDVNGDFTTVLDRAYVHLKDNRLLPDGFSDTHPNIDTTQVVGNAAQDSDHSGQLETSDIIKYRIPLGSIESEMEILVNIWYQSLPPRWMEEIFQVSTPEIEAFQNMFEAADRTPILIDETSVTLPAWVNIDEAEQGSAEFSVWPTVNSTGTFSVFAPSGGVLQAFSAGGLLIAEESMQEGINTISIPYKGMLIFVYTKSNGSQAVRRIMIIAN